MQVEKRQQEVEAEKLRKAAYREQNRTMAELADTHQISLDDAIKLNEARKRHNTKVKRTAAAIEPGYGRVTCIINTADVASAAQKAGAYQSHQANRRNTRMSLRQRLPALAP